MRDTNWRAIESQNLRRRAHPANSGCTVRTGRHGISPWAEGPHHHPFLNPAKQSRNAVSQGLLTRQQINLDQRSTGKGSDPNAGASRKLGGREI